MRDGTSPRENLAVLREVSLWGTNPGTEGVDSWQLCTTICSRAEEVDEGGEGAKGVRTHNHWVLKASCHTPSGAEDGGESV